MEQAQGTISGRMSVASATLVIVAIAVLLLPDTRAASLFESVPPNALLVIAGASVAVGIVLGHLARRSARAAGAEDDVAMVALVCHYLLIIAAAGAYLEGPLRDALSQVLDGVLG